MRKTVEALQEQCRLQVRSTTGVEVHVGPDSPAVCPQCQGPMHVRKTVVRKGQTIAHGVFLARETVFVCSMGCTQELPTPAGGSRKGAILRRSTKLARLLLPRRTIGYDVLVFVGLQRFIHHRQRGEIKAALESDFDIRLSTGEVSTLARDFLIYLEALHQERAPALREALAKDGGWPMHIDATGEDGRGTMLTVLAGWRGWVLGSWKIPTECADAILPRLRNVADLFGDPCAIMRDLGRAMTEAARTVVQERNLDIPILGCHFHFLRDVGEDLLEEAHDRLRGLFQRFKVRSGLRGLARDLGRKLGTEIDTARLELGRWLAEPRDGHELGDGDTGLAMVRALAQWVLQYKDDGEDEGFPFDLPYLDLWNRCTTVLRATEAYLRAPPADKTVRSALERLHRIVDPTRSELPFRHPATTLERRARIFAELRQALRIEVKPDGGPQATPSSRADQQDLQDIRKAVEKFNASLKERRPERGPAQDLRKAIDLVLEHLDRHGGSLWGHAITMPQELGGGTKLVERTNLLLEGFFGAFKHGERRRSGRKTLTQDLERLPGVAPLAANLNKKDYVAILCGQIEELPAAFAALDAGHRQFALPVMRRAQGDGYADVASASLPAGDRSLLRSKELRQKILAAARSRAPRRLPTVKRGKREAAE